MSQLSESKSVTISASLFERVENRVNRTDFESPDEYVTFVLEEVLHSVESADDEEQVEIDEAEVKNRLRSLGYLDE